MFDRKLPIGIQDFAKLRLGNFLYIDKTRYLYELVNLNIPYFISRPRRFGKSLFLSTLREYFLGKKELFEGLTIAEYEKDWTPYPVIYIDMSVGILTDVDSLLRRLGVILDELENQWGKTVNDNDPATRFFSVIRNASEKTGKKVVVLVDEYDKPLLSTLGNETVNDAISEVLKGFYGILKSADAYLHFIFLTGVTKFSKVSVFSDLNNLTDISLEFEYAGICGISETELLKYFQPEIKNLSEKLNLSYETTLAELKEYFDGYHFCENTEGIYNPFSILKTFKSGKFRNYWYETGTP
ncbi:MAG: AAA family ATPase, partial [Planctomycetaceae bacterium]|nr:AAA family ATPase [Planctomycetaceae bacterium]